MTHHGRWSSDILHWSHSLKIFDVKEKEFWAESSKNFDGIGVGLSLAHKLVRESGMIRKPAAIILPSRLVFGNLNSRKVRTEGSRTERGSRMTQAVGLNGCGPTALLFLHDLSLVGKLREPQDVGASSGSIHNVP